MGRREERKAQRHAGRDGRERRSERQRQQEKKKSRIGLYVLAGVILASALAVGGWYIMKHLPAGWEIVWNRISGMESKTPVNETEMLQNITESETETEKPQPVEILMSFTGDCILGTDESFVWETGFNAYYENYGGEYFFRNVRDIFEADDLTIVNMEGTLTEETSRQYKQFAFKGDPEFVDVLTLGSVEAANVANNHSHDYGEQSFLDTVNLLEQNNIRTFGYDDIALMEIKGVKIGMFGIYELDDHLERISQLERNIAKLKAHEVDIIVGVFHWSNELVTVPDSNQITLGHMAVDLGADIVVGHHPHVVQGIEEYNGKTIAYSLGNFCFGGNSFPTEMDTMILQQKFVLDENREIIETETTVIPCSVSSDATFNNYQPTVLEGEAAESCMERIRSRSEAIVY